MHRTLLGLMVLLGCAGSNAAPTTSPTKPASSTECATANGDDDDEVTPPMKATVASAPAAPVVAADGSFVLENILKKETPAADFPKPTTTDAVCNKGLGFTGTSSKDYPELMSKCGAPTGLKEFVKTVTGKLDEQKPRDIYTFKMLGGFCYRFFAVADDTVQGIKIRVQRPEGAVLSMAASKSFVTIMNPDGPWCKTKDREFRLVVETNGGKGNYSFGVWARPK